MDFLLLGGAGGANMFKRWMDKDCYCPVGVDLRDRLGFLGSSQVL